MALLRSHMTVDSRSTRWKIWRAMIINNWKTFKGGSRISEGTPTPEFRAKTYYLVRFLPKTAWKWKKLYREVGPSLAPPPPIRQWIYIQIKHSNTWLVDVSSGGSRIFPRGCASYQKCYYFSIFCRKLQKNERIWTPGDARPWRPPWIRHWSVSFHKL